MDVKITYFSDLGDGNGGTLESRVSGIVSTNDWPVRLQDATGTEVIAVCENEEQLKEELENRGIM